MGRQWWRWKAWQGIARQSRLAFDLLERLKMNDIRQITRVRERENWRTSKSAMAHKAHKAHKQYSGREPAQ